MLLKRSEPWSPENHPDSTQDQCLLSRQECVFPSGELGGPVRLNTESFSWCNGANKTSSFSCRLCHNLFHGWLFCCHCYQVDSSARDVKTSDTRCSFWFCPEAAYPPGRDPWTTTFPGPTDSLTPWKVRAAGQTPSSGVRVTKAFSGSSSLLMMWDRFLKENNLLKPKPLAERLLAAWYSSRKILV